jgi:hypothetical protein
MKYAIINPIDNSVYSVEDAMSAADIELNVGAPYIVHATDATLVGDIYDPDTATFTPLTAREAPGRAATGESAPKRSAK